MAKAEQTKTGKIRDLPPRPVSEQQEKNVKGGGKKPARGKPRR